MHWLAVALGGSLGAMCRYATAILLPTTPGKFPFATLIVNVAGSFLMGLFFVVIVEKGLLPIVWRQAIMVGFLGALTTYSTFSMEAFQLFYTGHWKLALSYALISVCLCIVAAGLSFQLFNKIL